MRGSELGRAAAFFGIAVLLCAGATQLAPLIAENVLKIAMVAPLASVLLMLFVLTQEGASRRAWLDLGLNRAGLSGWPLAMTVPIVVLGVAYGVVWTIGVGSLIAPAGFENPGAYVLDFVASITIVALLGGIGEEVGWRGYLLPRLLSLGVLPALLISGLMHGVFHLPVILLTPYYHAEGDMLIIVPLFLATLTAAGVCYGYLRLTTGSVWPAAIAHSTFNIVWDRFNAATQTTSPLTLEYLAGESGVLTLGTLTIASVMLARRLLRAG
jgi:membrane protease YdiL (CAAX protease family)